MPPKVDAGGGGAPLAHSLAFPPTCARPGGAASGLVGNLLSEVESLFRRDDAELEARAGLGGAIASSVAGGAASGLVGNLLSEVRISICHIPLR